MNKKELFSISHGARKHIRDLKAVHKYGEADKFRKEVINRSDKVKKRVDDHLEMILGILEEKLPSEELEELKNITPEEANIKIQVHYGVYNDVNTSVKIQMREMYEAPIGSPKREIATIEFLKLMHYLSWAFPEDMMELFKVNGTGKTNFEKCRKEVTSPKKG